MSTNLQVALDAEDEFGDDESEDECRDKDEDEEGEWDVQGTCWISTWWASQAGLIDGKMLMDTEKVG